jgi:hypothetical protein
VEPRSVAMWRVPAGRDSRLIAADGAAEGETTMTNMTRQPRAIAGRGPLLAILTDPALLRIVLLAAGISGLLLAVAVVL